MFVGFRGTSLGSGFGNRGGFTVLFFRKVFKSTGYKLFFIFRFFSFCFRGI